MALVNIGFSVADINFLSKNMDQRVFRGLMLEARDFLDEKRHLDKLDLGEAVYSGVAGTIGKNGPKFYKKWMRGIVRFINKLRGIKELTLWEQMEKNRKSRIMK